MSPASRGRLPGPRQARHRQPPPPGRGRSRPWLLQVAAVRRQPGSSSPISVSAPIEELSVSNAWVPDGSDVGFRGQLESALGGIVVVGLVEAPWEGTCRRCLTTARGHLEVEVRELASEDADPELGYPLSSDWLDLEPIVHDACILELPLAPLCREDCQGLCPECGANRNVETCSCAGPGDPRWAALAGLAAGGEVVQERDRQAESPDSGSQPHEDEPG